MSTISGGVVVGVGFVVCSSHCLSVDEEYRILYGYRSQKLSGQPHMDRCYSNIPLAQLAQSKYMMDRFPRRLRM
jgi:hypothetical protein